MTTVCSPHLRGWSPFVGNLDGLVRLLPAPAGMVPGPWRTTACTGPAPPRTRGDGPIRTNDRRVLVDCSPHPRGWPRRPVLRPLRRLLLSAPAGMAPGPAAARRGTRTAPRTRGDGPWTQYADHGPGVCSPHPRGWPQALPRLQHRHNLLPAPAGMAPGRGGRPAGPASAPRTRGDGPGKTATTYIVTHCSPHPRGWPRCEGQRRRRDPLLPAPAGMAPARCG